MITSSGVPTTAWLRRGEYVIQRPVEPTEPVEEEAETDE